MFTGPEEGPVQVLWRAAGEEKDGRREGAGKVRGCLLGAIVNIHEDVHVTVYSMYND